MLYLMFFTRHTSRRCYFNEILKEKGLCRWTLTAHTKLSILPTMRTCVHPKTKLSTGYLLTCSAHRILNIRKRLAQWLTSLDIDLTIRVQIQKVYVCVSLRANAFEKGQILPIQPLSGSFKKEIGLEGKVWSQNFGRAFKIILSTGLHRSCYQLVRYMGSPHHNKKGICLTLANSLVVITSDGRRLLSINQYLLAKEEKNQSECFLR